MPSPRHLWTVMSGFAGALAGTPFHGSRINVARDLPATDANTVACSSCPPPNTPDTPGTGPVFVPSGSNLADFKCEYPDMVGWEYCATPEDQSCWLRNPETGEKYDIETDYENKMPLGVDRYYSLDLTDSWINADGLNYTTAKIFNNTFPGPLIEACWGDRVHINVNNNLKHNGTSIHWHGLRQWNSFPMDGVNGISQCPIAPGDSFLYSWNATQYGSSWYHSHYSVQYADGAQAPITIHGPTSAPYDDAIEPLILTDWLHSSAFSVLTTFFPLEPTILLGSTGSTTGNITRYNKNWVADSPIPKIYEIHLDPIDPNPETRAKRYLLRLINTSWSTSFIFSIDNHNLTIVEADFVPVDPFSVTSVMISIGQRLHMIVEGEPTTNSSDPERNPIPEDGNFWVRTYIPGPIDVCGSGGNKGTEEYMNNAILRYDNTSTAYPTSQPWDYTNECSDTEINSLLKPILPWTVGPPSNGRVGEDFNVSLLRSNDKPYGTAFITLDRGGSKKQTPFQTDWGNPMFLNMDNTAGEWPVGWVVVPENYTDNDWVHLVLFGAKDPGSITFGPHPIHLHGHDFAILQEVDDQLYDPATYDASKNNYDNPPRRDVVLLPAQGYTVIAFKTDNPGAWLLHCHIALHASGGLSLQILERQADSNELWPPGNSEKIDEANRVCTNWRSWAYDCRNYWPGEVSRVDANGTETGVTYYPTCEQQQVLQNDSGVKKKKRQAGFGFQAAVL